MTTILALIILSVGAAIALVIGAIAFFISMLRKLLTSKDEANAGEDTRIIQDINSKLGRLEKRIESLETIITATERQPRS